MKNRIVVILTMSTVLTVVCQTGAAGGEMRLHVDPNRGSDRAVGSKSKPLKSLYGAIKRLPKEIEHDVTILLAAGTYSSTGGKGAAAKCLELNRNTYEGAKVRIVGTASGFDKPAPLGTVLLDWENQFLEYLLAVNQGYWTLENIQLGTRKENQSSGIKVAGPGLLELRRVRIHTAAIKGAGLRAHHGGRVHLYGTIELNEDLKDSGGDDESFCRIEAEYGGVVRFIQGKGATLTLGNGNLSASYYGVIELGCEQASITSWNYQSNPIAVNNSGRVDLHNTTTTVCARNRRNIPIGLEDDGHMLAEGAHIIIDGQGNSGIIVLQKASSFFCNDVEIRGQVRNPLLAMSGSVLLVGIHGDLGRVWAHSGSTIIIEKCTGSLLGPFQETKFGQIVLPKGKSIETTRQSEGKTRGDSASIAESESIKRAILPSLHRAAFGGHVAQVRRLIKEGADVRAKGPNGRTALHMAAMGGHRMVSEILLGEGGEIKACDNQGHTPAQLARMQGHNGLADFLRKWESETK
ncbi:MAG: ankyrin repeat domain-containing protein [Planctomycetota bacterium]|jgi:hypothetical protein